MNGSVHLELEEPELARVADPFVFWDCSGLHAFTHAIHALLEPVALEIVDDECACASL